MNSSPVVALMVHVGDVDAAFAWYRRAFAQAVKKTIPAPHDYSYLDIDGFMLELAPADEKVASGAAGSVAYWHVPDFRVALRHFESIGAVLYRGPLAIENGQSMCQVRDPWGNCIGLRGPYIAGLDSAS
jgi:predicted enzyme related to lactoylglutathione lyase